MDLMMNRTDRIRYFTGGEQVRGIFQSDGERVELRPPCVRFPIGLDAFRRVLLGDSGGDGGIQTSG